MAFREARQQSLTKKEELRKFQSSTLDSFVRRKFIEDQNTILELSGRVKELQNEVNCMKDSKDFQDAESIRSGNSHAEPQIKAAKHLGHTWYIGNVFADPHASSSAPYPQELSSLWKKNIEEPFHMSTAEKSERPERDQDQRCESGPSAKDSVIFSGGDSSKNYGADQQRLQISDLHFDKFPTPAT